jgi:hypothetical protein
MLERKGMEISFSSAIWRWQGDAPAAWHFVTLPEEVGAQVKFVIGKRKGFGMVRLKATIGKTSWKTSIFPDKKSGSFLLPVKADVRKSEKLVEGQSVKVTLLLDA